MDSKSCRRIKRYNEQTPHPIKKTGAVKLLVKNMKDNTQGEDQNRVIRSILSVNKMGDLSRFQCQKWAKKDRRQGGTKYELEESNGFFVKERESSKVMGPTPGMGAA